LRIIFFAGKGGVGKTSVSAATGIKAAERGQRTVIMSLDVAHSLADVFDLDRNLLDQNNGVPIKVRENLWIQELDIQTEIQRHWGDIHRYLSTMLNTTGLGDVLAEELAIFPGMEEVSLLLYINQYVRENKFDELIIRIGSFKRHILLSKQVTAFDAVKARVEGQHLNIIFEGGRHDR